MVICFCCNKKAHRILGSEKWNKLARYYKGSRTNSLHVLLEHSVDEIKICNTLYMNFYRHLKKLVIADDENAVDRTIRLAIRNMEETLIINNESIISTPIAKENIAQPAMITPRNLSLVFASSY